MQPRKPPSYRLHKPSGQAIVTLSGKMHYLGRHGSEQSHREYERLVAEWLAAGRTPAAESGPSLTVEELLAAYWRHVETKRHPHQHADSIRRALAVARRLYGGCRAGDFRGKALKACRQAMLDEGLCRTLVNQRVGHLKRCFRWGLAEELVAADAVQSVLAVPGLRRGEAGAREAAPVPPVAVAVVEATLPHLPPTLADAVRVQLHSGMRPGEVLAMRGDELDRVADDLWVWRPAQHKTAHRGIARQVFLGPRAIAALSRHADAAGGGYLFSPARARDERLAALRARRKTKVQPSQLCRARPGARPPRERYRRDTYAAAVARACRKAGLPHWHPNQLRHTAATLVAAQHGWEAARLLLGHRSIQTTRIYVEDDLRRIADVVRRVG